MAASAYGGQRSFEIRTACGGNPAVLSLLPPLAVPLLLKPRLQISDPDIVARYARWLELLRQAAVTGAEAAEMCRRTAAGGLT